MSETINDDLQNGGTKRDRPDEGEDPGDDEPATKVAKLDDQFDDPPDENDCGTPPADPEQEATADGERGHAVIAEGATTAPADNSGDPVTTEQNNQATSEPNNTSSSEGNPGSEETAPKKTEGQVTHAEGSQPQAETSTNAESSSLFTVDRAGADPAELVQPAIPTPNPGPPHHYTTGPAPSNTASSNPSGPEHPSGVPAASHPPPVDPSAQATLISPAAPSQAVEEREEISAAVIGKVIGKGGEMIRDLQARSGARIDVDQNVPMGQPRVVTYRGTRATVDFARTLVRMLTVEGVSETDLPLGQAFREILHIPSQAVGKVIGRGGEMIRELQSRSGAKIQVDHHGGGPAGVPPDKKQVTIIGNDLAVMKAKEMVMFLVANPMMDALQALSMLIEDKIRGSVPWGKGPPYPSLPNQGYNMTPDMVGPSALGGGYSAVGGAYQPPTAYGGPQAAGAYGMAQPIQAAAPYQTPYGQYGAGGGTPPVAGPVEVDVTYVQKQYTGRIIGQRGVTINDLQRRSGCDIQVKQAPSGNDTEITIKGSRQGIEMVKQMIREILEAGPAHPYAGGADAGFGGGSQYGGGGGGGYGKYPQQQQQQQQPQQGYDYSQSYGGYAQQQQGYGQPQQPAYGQQAFPPQQGGYAQASSYTGGYGQQQLPTYGAVATGYAAAPGVAYGGPPAVPAVAAPPQPRVSAWKAATTPDGQVYYYNEQTGETQWEKPAGM